MVLNTDAVGGMQQIDCIGISSTTAPYKQAVNVLKYSETIGQPENLGPNVNSQYTDHLPLISPDGSILYFTRKFAEDNMGKDHEDDIYSSYILPSGKLRLMQSEILVTHSSTPSVITISTNGWPESWTRLPS